MLIVDHFTMKRETKRFKEPCMRYTNRLCCEALHAAWFLHWVGITAYKIFVIKFEARKEKLSYCRYISHVGISAPLGLHCTVTSYCA